jgi:hypothetical protein
VAVATAPGRLWASSGFPVARLVRSFMALC